ncbi:CRISPR-associated endonuclease Cas3'' [Haloferax sp. MBLA0076]|uniref:CRISPR-associated endonuclease Cas3 n=1 Tax=Haloferax litoreum TaxID=2666140 RepID=A0A6A8GH68_9EURY|nr:MULTISPECIES: CRISPR-associated endonuclease Cas3'' [Haloferax]KAB1193635.1 CRISPR-associated endonuclease Cas3'' [Haloferax sp. CBA1148]MRX22161.1 CRISPR-associated endonuclease Cas3'' [Haloferax litoreum]
MEGPRSHPAENGRPARALVDHLTGVVDRVDHIVPNDTTTPNGESLQEVVKALAYVHDIGKASSWFQAYLDDERIRDKRLRHHAPIGSFAAYYVLDARGYTTETCLAGFVAVAKHHGRIPDVAEYVYNRSFRRGAEGVTGRTVDPREQVQDAVYQQIVDIDGRHRDIATQILQDASGGGADWESFRASFWKLLDEVSGSVESLTGGTPTRDALSDSCYELVLQCWSALVLADKTDAARAPDGSEIYAPKIPSLAKLDSYVDDLDTDPDPDGTRAQQLDYHRARARESVLSGVEAFAESGGGVATLTLPTGMGKTLSGLSAAFALRDRLKGKRVVYALPFTSIIDQVVGELTDIYDDPGRLLTVHHHLSETTFDPDVDGDEVDLNDDVAGMLGESWRAGLTVTTFVQLFESLAGPANSQSMKLPALHDAVIVLDEPQSLPLDWWKLVPRLIRILTERYDASVIAMTATQPRLFEGTDVLDNDVVELVQEPNTYFAACERVEYRLHGSVRRYLDDREGPVAYQDAAAAIRAVARDDESALAVCNTIESARRLTKEVTDGRQHFVDVAEEYANLLRDSPSADEPGEGVDSTVLAKRCRGDGPALIHLSTRLRPVDRLTLIETAKKLTMSGVPVVAVSTQLIEAGVDISFDHVFRDLAPVDSIVQAAGRCNRSFERNHGVVTVWWLDAPSDQKKTPAEAIYNRGTSLLPVTAKVLHSIDDGSGVLPEHAVARDAVEDYYHRLHKNRNVGSQEFVEYVDDARGDELGKLSLIDSRRAADVVICRTDIDRNLVERLREAREAREYTEVRNLLDATKPIRISVPFSNGDETAETIKHLPPIDRENGLYQLDIGQHGGYFNQTTGFVVPEITAGHRIL